MRFTNLAGAILICISMIFVNNIFLLLNFVAVLYIPYLQEINSHVLYSNLHAVTWPDYCKKSYWRTWRTSIEMSKYCDDLHNLEYPLWKHWITLNYLFLALFVPPLLICRATKSTLTLKTQKNILEIAFFNDN